MSMSLEGRVAIVTGAGGGLGRCHALALAKRGAKLVINDLGGSLAGEGSSLTAAESVVEEIKALGGDAIAHGASVTDEAAVDDMVQQAKAEFGRIDILVNNAGILRDKSFAKMTVDDFRAVVDVHLIGSAIVTKAVWDTMRDQAYGRIVMTTSSSGLFGNFGQANYGAAKMGLVGLMHTLCLEGAKYNIRVNCLSPVAATRMTENLMPAEALALLKPELVSPAVEFMVSEDAPNRTIISAGAGVFARASVHETLGMGFTATGATAEAIRDNWNKINDADTLREPKAGAEQSMNILTQAAQMAGLTTPDRRSS